MSELSMLLTEMSNINAKANQSSNRYTVITVDTTKLKTLIQHHSGEPNFCKAYGITHLNKVTDGDTTQIYIDKSETSVDLQSLLTDLSGSVLSEYYGLVQFDGDEPEAQGYYNSEYTNDPMNSLSMSLVPNSKKRKMKLRAEAERQAELAQRMAKATKVQSDESTEASAVTGAHVGSVNIIGAISDHAPAKKQMKIRA